MTPIEAFIDAVENHHFVEAHEMLEDEWKAYKKQGLKKEAKAVQGLINGATALALRHIKKREEPYKRVWAVFKKYEALLDEINIDNLEKYIEAKELLMKKNRELI